MTEKSKQTDNQVETKQVRINRALGVFMVFFALVVLIAIFFTDTTLGKLTNLGAGLVIGAIGMVMIIGSRPRGKKPAES